MSDQSQTPGRDQSPEQSPRRSASSVSKQEYAARSQRWKEGSPLEWQVMLRDMQQNEELHGIEDEFSEDSEEDLWESEIDLGDEDSLGSEQQDPLDDLLGDDFQLGGDAASSDDFSSLASSGSCFRIVVTGGHSRLEVPRWLAGRPPRDEANHPLEEPFQRLETFQRLSGWLNESRHAFLKDPDPWHLGIDALEELNKGAPSVTERGLLHLLGLKSEINRHKRYCDLVWEDGSLPLDFLFSPEAKQAWVANALVQRYRATPLTEEALGRVASLTVQKNRKENRARLSQNIDSLSFPQFIQRLCLESGATWSGVLNIYRDRILSEFQQA